MQSYKMNGTCARAVNYQVDEMGKIKNVEFVDGCDGNLKGLALLLEGMEVEDAIKRLEGITCGSSSTSCPDQFSKALKEYTNK